MLFNCWVQSYYSLPCSDASSSIFSPPAPRPWPSRPIAEHAAGCPLELPAEEMPGRFYLVLPASGQVRALDIYGQDVEPGRSYTYCMTGSAGASETGDAVDFWVDLARGAARWHFSAPAVPAAVHPRFCPACAEAMRALAAQSGPGAALIFDAEARELLAPRGGRGLSRGDYRFCYSRRERALTAEYLPGGQQE